MGNCLNCAYAKWERTANDRLHPSGNGNCSFVFILPKLPKSMYFVGGGPKPCGGSINRKEPEENCPQFTDNFF